MEVRICTWVESQMDSGEVNRRHCIIIGDYMRSKGAVLPRESTRNEL